MHKKEERKQKLAKDVEGLEGIHEEAGLKHKTP